MIADLKELWRFRELLGAMVEREIRIRYKNSLLGFFWSLLSPLVTVIVMTLVFKFIQGNKTESYSIYILAAYLPFLFFQLALMDSAQSVLSALPVVKKVYFPREILPLASIFANFIHLLLALLVMCIFMGAIWAYYRGPSPFNQHIWFLPVLLVVNLALSTGLSLMISSLNVFYEDVKYVVGIALYMLFFLTPVMYFNETVFYSSENYGQLGRTLFFIYNLNPIATLATVYRKTIVASGQIEVRVDSVNEMRPALPFDYLHFGIAVFVSFTLLFLGYALFNRLKWKFVERP